MNKIDRDRMAALGLAVVLAFSVGTASVLAGEEDDWLPPLVPGASSDALPETEDAPGTWDAPDTDPPSAPDAPSDMNAPDADAPSDTAGPDTDLTDPADPVDPASGGDAAGTLDGYLSAVTTPGAAPAVTTPGTASGDPWAPPDADGASGTGSGIGTGIGSGTGTGTEDDWLPPSAPDAPSDAAVPVEEDLSWQAGPDDGGVSTEEAPRLSSKQQRDRKELEELLEQVTVSPDALESVAFGNVERLTRSRNLTLLGLEETIAGIEGMDYEKMQDDMRSALNGIARSQSMIELAGGMEPVAASSAVRSMQSAYDSLYEQFKAIRDGDLQKNNRDLIRQLRNAEDQMVMGGEALYIALVSMETQEGSLERQLNALNRTVEEMELRYSLGQISALTLGEVKTGRSSLVSGLETLRMNLRTYKMQLETMLGAAPTGTIRLGGLPSVTEAQIRAMDVEADLAAAKEKSYELYAAAVTLDDAKETRDTQSRTYHYNPSNAMYQQVQRTWTAAQDTYNNALLSYELKFRTLYEKVRDDHQIWENAKVSLTQQEASYAASALKRDLGDLSENALLSARDELDAAKEAVRSAADTLFSDYNNYCWAVQHGILN